MPRYLVERALAGAPELSVGEIVERNTDSGVMWMHSYVSDDARRMLCLYEAPSPEAIRRAARRNDLPIDRITKVRILDPYSYPDQRRSQ